MPLGITSHVLHLTLPLMLHRVVIVSLQLPILTESLGEGNSGVGKEGKLTRMQGIAKCYPV